ncbi:ATP-binding cassette domain-containing protein [Treponema sp. R6D11]
MIEIKNVKYTYNPSSPYEKKALKGINLSINEGEIVSIVGHTGSGKSTLIQIIAGLLMPTSGVCRVFDVDTNDKNKLAEVRKNIGMVFQYPENQIFEETVFDEIAFAPKNFGLSGDDLKEAVFWAADALRIPNEMLDEMPHHLSGGWKRKIAIASVLAFKPKLLILDEPTAGLDPVSRRDLIELIRKISKDTSVVFISHYMQEIAEIADRIIVMNKGRVLLDGKPKDILTPKLEEIGLDIPDVTKLALALGKKKIITYEDAIKCLRT